MDFSSALHGMKAGHAVRRKSWPEPKQMILMDEQIHIAGWSGELAPISAILIPAEDILAIDWELS